MTPESKEFTQEITAGVNIERSNVYTRLGWSSRTYASGAEQFELAVESSSKFQNRSAEKQQASTSHINSFMLTSHHAFRPAERSLAWIHGSMNYPHPEVLASHQVGRTGPDRAAARLLQSLHLSSLMHLILRSLQSQLPSSSTMLWNEYEK